MKIYFTASARGKKLYGDNYKRIYELIKEFGHTNLDDLILKLDPKKFYLGSEEARTNLYKRTLDLIKKAEAVILEVSTPSLSMGYVMDRALREGKPVVILYLEGLNPYFAEGVQDEKLQVLSYTPDTIKKILREAIRDAKEQVDVRFNFFISPKIGAYLDWIAKTRKTPRAVYLRRLIERDMKKSRKYQ